MLTRVGFTLTEDLDGIVMAYLWYVWVSSLLMFWLSINVSDIPSEFLSILLFTVWLLCRVFSFYLFICFSSFGFCCGLLVFGSLGVVVDITILPDIFRNMKLIRHWGSKGPRMWPKWGLLSITSSAEQLWWDTLLSGRYVGKNEWFGLRWTRNDWSFFMLSMKCSPKCGCPCELVSQEGLDSPALWTLLSSFD